MGTAVRPRLAKLPRNDEALRQFMHDEFYAYQMLTSTRSATGKLTGYFEPLIAGSLQQQGALVQDPDLGVPRTCTWSIRGPWQANPAAG